MRDIDPNDPVSNRTAMPAGQLRGIISGIWQEVLGCGPVDADTTFFELGGSSGQLSDVQEKLESLLGISFDFTLLFEAARFSDLAARLQALVGAQPDTADAKFSRKTPPQNAPIAIIGLAGRFPGAADINSFWQSLRKGENLIPRFDETELEDAVGDATRRSPAYVPSRSVLADADKFDAAFFDILPAEAKVMDPQARVFLEICAEALDNAGLDPRQTEAPIGVFAGATFSTYLLANLLQDRAALDDFTATFQIGNYTTMTGNTNDSLAGRVAYKLGLKGPAVAVSTACSTSLTAIAQACQSLRAGQSDMALAGGVSITFPQKRGYLAQEGGMTAPDGICRPFDADAGGTVFGHGAGVVVLKRLSDALDEGDHIHAVIRGVGISNDGSDKFSYTAPSATGQARAITMAHRDAGVTGADISFVECHGTATPLGDPIEIKGLRQAFGPVDGDRIALGSVKGNIGHLATAAGVMGVIKTVLMLTHREIPPVAHFRAPNPKLDLDTGPFFVPQSVAPWTAKGPLCAGVSSTGIGGTNVHLVLEQAPEIEPAVAVNAVQILPLSAKSPEALAEMAENLAAALENTPSSLADIAFTLQEGRAAHPFRLAIVAQDHKDADKALRAKTKMPEKLKADSPPLVFMFPGQGSQYPGMGHGLYRSQPDYAKWIDAGAEILQPLIGFDLRDILCKADLKDKDAARALRDTKLTQPALYLTEYATAQLWFARGVRPDRLIGHSVGEFAAAALAGVFDFETGLRMIAERGRLMQAQPAGSMLSVLARLDSLEPHLDGSVDLAAMNAPGLQVVAGPDAAIDALESRLKQAGMSCSRLHTSHAFHSAMMDGVVPELEKMIAAQTLNAPEIPIISTVTGEMMTPETAQSPAYWAGQARAAVNFQAALQAACQTGSEVFVEVGAGRTLSIFATQILDRGSRGRVFHSLPDHTPSVDDESAMAAAFANLWCLGRPVDWSLSGPRGARKVPLPGYAFQRKSFWVDPRPAQTQKPPVSDRKELPDMPIENAHSHGPDRVNRFKAELLAQLSCLSGIDLATEDADATFLELGFDSLFLTQVAKEVGAKYQTNLTFRSLLSDTPSIAALAGVLDQTLALEQAQAEPVVASTAVPKAAPTPPEAPAPIAAIPPAPVNADFAALVAQQNAAMQAMFAEQLRALSALQTGETPHAATANIRALPTQTAAQPIAPRRPDAAIPLTEGQREIWMAHQMGDATACCFNQSTSLRLTGHLDQAALLKAVNLVVARHDALRMVFDRDGTAFHIASRSDLNLKMLDVSGDPDPEAALGKLLDHDARTPVDIVNDRPVRAMLVKLAAERTVLVLTMHHIACDGWSYNVLYPEIAEAYNALAAGQAVQFDPAASYGEFALMQHDRAENPAVKAYWQAQFKTIPPLPDLPTDRPRPARRGYQGATVTVEIGSEDLQTYRKLGTAAGCTLFATLFSALNITLSNLSGARDLVIGVPFGGRGDRFKSLVGHCINFLPIRSQLDFQASVKTLLTQSADRVLNAFEHEDTTYGTLLNHLNVPRDVNRLPLTEVMFNLRREKNGPEMAGLTAKMTPNAKAAVNFDLFFNMIESSDGLRVDVDYNAEIYDAATVRRWVGHMRAVLASMAKDVDARVADVPLLTDAELASQTTPLPETVRSYDMSRSVLDLIAERAAQMPKAVAVEDGLQSLTYAELGAKSDALAAVIQARLPEAGQRVAVSVLRSGQMLIALLAVLKAGHAYVPLDPRQPDDRLRTILKTARVTGIISDDSVPGFASDLDLTTFDTAETGDARTLKHRAFDPSATAYVIFTSGSTGTPKGVEISHGAFLNFLLSMAEKPGFTARDTILAVTTVMFDIAALELFLPLVSGGKVVIAQTEDILDGFRLVERLKRGDISVMQATPTLWDMLLEAGFKPAQGLKILAGGEPLPRDLANRLTQDGAELWNMYGPTETTIWSAVKKIGHDAKITIGGPVANTALLVLDSFDRPAPIGVVGELNIGGAGLAKGYFDQPDLTQAAFRGVMIAGRPENLYRTGDLARLLPDGEIQVLGRKDTQIKLRGFRIELGDIETRLRALDGVEKAAVDLRLRASGSSQLVAYVVARAGVDLDTTQLAAELALQLPDYMVPQGWIMLSQLPQTANGKLDRKALPDPDQKATVEPIRSKPATTSATEQALTKIWCNVLGLPEISPTESLYALGVDSLMIFKIAARMLDEGLELEARDLMAHPSIRELAAFADARNGVVGEVARPSLKSFLNGKARRQGTAS